MDTLHGAIARFDGGTFIDDFDWSYMSPDGLSVRAAWTMAMAWCHQIQNRLTLLTDEGAIRNYEWIEFKLDYQSTASIAAARASSIVWRALVACRGFGSGEHPVFWKRLFDALQQSGFEEGYADKDTITDANLFFHGGVAFPRFRLRETPNPAPGTVEIAQAVRVFCGLETDSQCGMVYTRMDEILDRLRPYVKASNKILAPIELSLDLVGELDREHELNAIISSIQASRADTVDPMRYPNFTLDVVRLREPGGLEDQFLWDLTCGATIQVASIAFRSISVDSSKLAYKSFVRWALNTNVHRGDQGLVRNLYQSFVRLVPGATVHREGETQVPAGGIRHVQYQLRRARHRISTICSALPYARTLETFELVAFDVSNFINELDLAWLGYALFHPDAGKSSWHRLLLRGVGMAIDMSNERTPLRVWELMAKGNNLHYFMCETCTVVDKYFQATIRADSAIRSLRHQGSEAIEHVLETSQFDVCVQTTDTKKLGKWVCVIVVGYGAAWVRSSSIIKIVARSPGRAKLSTLRFRDCPLEGDMELEQLLRMIGGQLDELHLDCSRVKPLDLARLTPQLQSLRVHCSQLNLDQLIVPVSVRTLSLMERSEVATVSGDSLHHLPNLTALHVGGRLENLTMQIFTETLVPILQGSPHLRHICWQAGSERELRQEFEQRSMSLTYPMVRFFSCDLRWRIEAEGGDCIGGKTSRDALVALLSVVRRSGDGSAMAKLDGELVRVVGRFLGRQLPQLLYVVRH